MNGYRNSGGLEAAEARTNSSTFPVIVVATLALLLPLFDTLGVGPVFLAVACLFVAKGIRGGQFAFSIPVAAAYFLVVLAACFIGAGNRNIYYDALIFLLLVPSGFFFGHRLANDSRALVTFFKSIVLIVAIGALLGVIETLIERYLFTNSLFSITPSRDGQFRGRAFFPQSLVLAVFCAAAIPLALSSRVFRRFDSRLLLTVFLLGGVVASGSRGVVACIGVCLCLILVYRGRSSQRLKHVMCAILVILGFVLLLILAGNPFAGSGTSLVTSTDAATASAQYRAELYRQIVPVVVNSPSGTGLGRVPDGIITFRSTYGNLDASRTVDSEIVLILLKFGVAGAVLYIMLWWASIRWLVATHGEYAQSLVVFLFAGVFLALESWLSIAFVIAVLAGISASASSRASSVKIRPESLSA
ncbi:hypothetical protein RhoFasGS6_02644 [Rhodococcus fascians]|nr:hypothetical protein [Rhodococcus fascians]